MFRSLTSQKVLHAFQKATTTKVGREMLMVSIVTGLATVGLYFLFEYFHWPTQIVIRNAVFTLHISLLSLALFCYFWYDSVEYLRFHQEGLKQRTYMMAGLIITFPVMASFALHELAHSLVARLLGVPTGPAIFSWYGMNVLSGGMETVTPLQQLVIAIAGPYFTLVVALFLTLVVKRYKESLPENLVQYMAVINVRLFRLSLAPYFLFDGGKITDAFVRLVTEDIYIRVLCHVILLYIIMMLYQVYRMFNPKRWDDVLADL